MRRVFLCALGALIFVGLISASALANPLDASQGPWSPAWCRSEQSVSAPAGLGSADWEQISGQILAAREAARLSGPATTEAISLLPQSFGGLVQQAYLKASNAESNDYMGFSVAIDGDTVVVGAPDENSSATGVNGNQADNTCFRSGAAYVFVRSGTTWTQQAYLKASNTGSIDDFGVSVAISGDTIIVGARTEDSAATGVNGNQADNSADGAGAAYVFVRSGTTWTQQAYLKASNAGAGDFFGYAVAISGETAVVSACREASAADGVDADQADNSAFCAGAAYVFVRSGTTWTQQAYLKASNAEFNDSFGYAVSVSGDTVVVGAPYEESAATGVNGDESSNSSQGSGAAYVFVRSGTTWTQQAYLKSSNTEIRDYFGASVDIDAGTVVVGALREDGAATGIDGNQTDNTATDSGAAYIFARSGDVWSQQAFVKASNTDAGDCFGYTVAISGGAVVVGAPYEASSSREINGNQADDSAVGAGAIYLYTRIGAVWAQTAYLKSANADVVDLLSYSLDIDGESIVGGAVMEDSAATGVNGDGTDNSASSSGAAYVFAPPPPAASTLTSDTPASDSDGDGTTILAVRLAGTDDSSPVSGAEILFSADLNGDGDSADAGESLGSAFTDADGKAVFSWDYSGLAYGSYDVVAEFEGGGGFLADDVPFTLVLSDRAPAVDAGADAQADEGVLFVRDGSFADPGEDAFAATVDYGDGTGVQVLVLDAGKVFRLSHTYGDDGDYMVSVVVNDGYLSGSDGFTVRVRNQAPAVTLGPTTGTLDLGGQRFLVAAIGQGVTFEARASDPGSDDLTFTAGPTSRVFYNSGSTADPARSPGGTAPFAAQCTLTYTYQVPGLYSPQVRVTDDDQAAGTGISATQLVVRGLETASLSVEEWAIRFTAAASGTGSTADAAFLAGYLADVTYMSSLLGPERAFWYALDLRTSADAGALLSAYTGGTTAADARALLLAAWLDYASGADEWGTLVDTDGDGGGDLAFCLVLSNAERLLNAASPAPGDVERACALLRSALHAQPNNPDNPDTPSFSDVPATHTYYAAIVNLCARGVISGYPDGTFRPDEPLTRQQTAKMLAKVLGLTVTENDACPFGDVQTSLPGALLDPSDQLFPDHYIAACVKAGVIKGRTASSFAPYSLVSREQLISMVVRASGLPEAPAGFVSGYVASRFSCAEHYDNAVRAAYAGLTATIEGIGPAYDFTQTATRGECAELLCGLLKVE